MARNERNLDKLRNWKMAGAALALGAVALGGCSPSANAERPPVTAAQTTIDTSTPTTTETTPSATETGANYDPTKVDPDPTKGEPFKELAPKDQELISKVWKEIGTSQTLAEYVKDTSFFDERVRVADIMAYISAKKLNPVYEKTVYTFDTDSLSATVEDVEVDPSLAVESVNFKFDVADRLGTISSEMAGDPKKYDPELAKGNLDAAILIYLGSVNSGPLEQPKGKYVIPSMPKPEESTKVLSKQLFNKALSSDKPVSPFRISSVDPDPYDESGTPNYLVYKNQSVGDNVKLGAQNHIDTMVMNAVSPDEYGYVSYVLASNIDPLVLKDGTKIHSWVVQAANFDGPSARYDIPELKRIQK